MSPCLCGQYPPGYITSQLYTNTTRYGSQSSCGIESKFAVNNIGLTYAVRNDRYDAILNPGSVIMSNKWYDYFVSKASFRGSNVFTIAGSLLILASLMMPWYLKSYRFSSSTVSPAEILIDFIYWGRTVPPYSIAAILYLLVLSLIAPFLKQHHAAALALGGFALMGLTLFLNAVPAESFGWGLIVTGTGLLLLLPGFFQKAV